MSVAVTRHRDVHVVDRAAAQVGEGPAWDASLGELAWVDITAGLVHFSGTDGSRRSIDVGTHVGAVLPAAGGGWLLAVQRGLARLAPSGTVTDVVDLHSERPDLRCNDAKCDPLGRAFVGTMAYDERPGEASLYRVDPGLRATPVLDGLTLANGLGWSPDGSMMWFIDSATQRVGRYRYDLESGRMGTVEATIEIPAAVGMPDGMCVDDDGCAWVGLWGGSVVHRYTPDGRLDAVIEMPASQITSCAFGGPGQGTLFITSATHQMTTGALAAEPLAGALFAVDVGVTGPAAVPWENRT